MKRIVSVLICIVIVLCTFTLPASALESVNIEQVFVTLPEITATLKFSTSTSETVAKEDLFAKLGGETLDVTEFEKYNREDHKTTIYFLVDSSSSIGSGYFSEVKRKLAAYSDGLTENEKMVLISFGSTTRTVLDGSENAQVRKQKINALVNNEGQTNLFDAVKKAVEMSQSDTEYDCERSFAVVISDGENFETRGGNTLQEVEKSVEGHGLPIYAFCVDATNSNASAFGSFARTSGGEIFTSRSPAEVSANFDRMVNATREVYLVSMLTKSNQGSDGSQKNLMIRAKEKSSNVDVKATRWIKDDVAPVVKDVTFEIDENGMMKVYVYYSENVLNADNPENFRLTRNDGKKEITFTEAEYHFTSHEYYTILTPKVEPAENDDYKIEIENVTDSSNEENALEKSTKSFSLGEKSGVAVFLLQYWWIILIVLVLAVIIAVVVVLAKNKKPENKEPQVIQQIIQQPVYNSPQPNVLNEHEYEHGAQVVNKEKHHILAPEGKKLRMKILCDRTAVRTVDLNVVEKITVGRSDSCDVYLDDMKMSRVHFEIVCVNGEFWLKDCNSANGTLLNNIRINSNRKLMSGDEIIAGKTKFTVAF